MLILTRRLAQAINIGDEVKVTVIGVIGDQVRFEIEAPHNVVIERAELLEEKYRRGEADRDDDSRGNK